MLFIDTADNHTRHLGTYCLTEYIDILIYLNLCFPVLYTVGILLIDDVWAFRINKKLIEIILGHSPDCKATTSIVNLTAYG